MKVLIVDDEEHVRDAIEYLIEWDKFGVTERYTAGSVAEARKLIDQHKPQILFCDIKMPEQNGIHLIEQVKQSGENIQTIVISGYDDFEYMRAVIQAKAVDYLLKPIRKEEVENALEQAIANWKDAELADELRKLIGFDKNQVTDTNNTIVEIKNFLDEHYHEKITLDMLVSKFYLTPQYISNRFKELYQMSVIEYVTFLKIKRAKVLLLQTKKPIIDIAFELGFSNENYFSKVFKKHEELSPKKFREKYL